ncbi:MAG TPA: hypothetical protein VEX15_21215 [Nocardioidaceae bacterium]|nr:hypothetical protein [Nocardioidaceae bacterium]
MIRFVKGFGQFWYDFVIGDDWKIAAAVVIALGVTLALLLSDALSTTAATVFGGAALVVAFVASMVIDVRRSS